MRFLVIFQTLLAAAIAAKLPTYSLPSHQNQPNVGTPLPSPTTRPPGQQIQPHADQNGLIHTYESSDLHVEQQLLGSAGGNGLTHTLDGTTRPQEPFQFQGPTGHDVFIQTFDEPAGSVQGFVRPTESNDLNQIIDESTAPFASTQHHGTDGQNFFQSSSVQPQVPSHYQGTAGLISGGSCPQDQVVHADGSCVVPEVTRDLYVFSIPDTPRRPAGPPPALPPPRVHEHVLFIRAPESGFAAKPLLVPPPAQKSVVYILREDSPDEEQRIIQAPAPPPARPEVFFVNYEDGENPTLHGGLDLQQVLQTVTSAPPALQDAAAPHHVQEQQTHSLLAGHAGGDLVLEDHSDEDLTLGGFTAHGAPLGGHSDATFALGGHNNGDQQPGSYNNGNQQSGTYYNGNQQLEGYSNSNQQSGSYTNGNQQSGNYNNGNQQPESHNNGIRQLEGHSNGNQQLGGHNNDHLALTVVVDDDFELGEHRDHDVSLEGHSDDTFVLTGHDGISLEGHTDDDFLLRHQSQGDLVLGSQSDVNPTNTVLSVQRGESAGQGVSDAQESVVEAPSGFAFQNSGDFEGDHTQEGENRGYAVPATLLGANLGRRDDRFSGSVDSEEAGRGAVDTVTDAEARFNGNLYGPPTASPATPSLLYTQP